MSTSEWPSVGLHDSSLTHHASNIRIDIENIHRHIGQGNDAIPSEVFLAFSFSVLELVEKVLDQPNLNDVFDLVKKIDLRTEKTLRLIEKSPTSKRGGCIRTGTRAGDNGRGTQGFLPDNSSGESVSADVCTEDEVKDEETAQDPRYKTQEKAAAGQETVSSVNGNEEQEWMDGFGVLADEEDGPQSSHPHGLAVCDEGHNDLLQECMGCMSSLIDADGSGGVGEEGKNLLRDSSPMKITDPSEHQTTATFSTADAITPSSARVHRTKTTKIVLPATSEGDSHGKIYSPLSKERKEIRVVHLSCEADPSFDILCTFSAVSLDDKPVYRALSYTWGDAKDTLPIILNGHRFQVTRNLKAALRRLRELDTTIPVWIDAICINQQDLEERTHQVQLMRNIYQSTAEVIVFLGEPSPRANKTLAQQSQDDKTWDSGLFNWTADDTDIENIDHVIQYVQAYADTYPDLPDERAANPLLLMMCFIRLLAGDLHLKDIPLMQNINIQREYLHALQGLIQQPWWSRIWCVQEVLLPPAVLVVYGRFKAPLQMYADAATNLQHHQSSCCKDLHTTPGQPDFLQSFNQKMSSIMEGGRLWQDDPTTTLMTLLSIYYSHDATDARDKIYGLLGLIRYWGDSAPLIPDYSISDARLFEIVAFNIITTTKSLDLLSFRAPKIMERIQMMQFVDELRENTSPAPGSVPWPFSSWATDWGRINEAGYETIVTERIARGKVFNACGNLPAPPCNPLFTERGPIGRATVLTVFAYRIGKIRDDFWDERSYMMPLLTTPFNNIVPYDLPLPLRPTKELKKPYTSGGNRYDAICRALCGDTFFADDDKADTGLMFRRATTEDVQSVKLWRQWLRNLNEPHGLREIPVRKDFDSEEEYQHVLAADRAVRSAGLLRRYVEMEQGGYVGLAADARGNDEIMVLLGAKTPYVLRSAGCMKIEGLGVKQVYALVGECYLVGCMDGEFVQSMQGQGKEPEEVYLI